MSSASEYQYQTKQRDCSIRWNLFKPENYIKDKVVLDIGCAEGWFVNKSLECGAKRSIGIDTEDYNCKGKGEYFVADAFLDINVDVVFLLSVSVDIGIIKHLRENGVGIIFFEPYLDSENKNIWKENEWLERFREVGYDFYQLGVSDRNRSLYLLKLTDVYKRGDNAIKVNVSDKEREFYNTFRHNTYILPNEFDGGKLILPWAETTLRLSKDFSYVKDIELATNWLHSLGIVHGDIRISNVVVYHMRAYLIDFSLWRYGIADEDSGVNALKGKRGIEYIKNSILSGRIRYCE